MRTRRILPLILIITMLFSLVGCSSTASTPLLSDPNEDIITESTITEDTITEDVETEDVTTENVTSESITSEVYLTELVEAENQITELLESEEDISEVTFCETVYVPQENLSEFAQHSQTSQLMGENVDLSSVLTKVAVGTGVIVTCVILKKVGIPEEIASIVVSAADNAIKDSVKGGSIGTLFGAFVGAADSIDETGRASAVAGFALTTAGLILATISAITEVPSAGTSSFGVAEGIHLAFAGVRVIAATAGVAYSAKKMIKTFQSTEATDIDWDNIDWEAAGVSAAQKATDYGADGYMWGAVYGAIDGTVEGYFKKYFAPYTQYKKRYGQVPAEGHGGHWTGDPGESEFVLDEPLKLSDGTVIKSVKYQNAIPDFSPYEKAQVPIDGMTNKRLGANGNFTKADTELAKYWSKIHYNNQKTWSSADVEAYRTSNGLTWHEMSNMQYMQLVPSEVNSTFTHYGGVAEYNVMTGETVTYD